MALVRVEAKLGSRSVPGEEQLIARARAMEAAAWDEIYTEHFSAIYRYCSFRITEPGACEDLTSEVFLEAVRGIRRYQYRGVSFRAWLYRIAHNLVADERKRRLRQSSVEVAEPEGPAEPGGPDFAPALVDRSDLQQALRQLTEDQQQVVVLRFVEGLSLQETATVMGRPSGAIKALQHRAMVRMRGLLAGEVRG
ncbi:MAG: sigma-70 family RNA polymerase sigma factor [Dehalococcoidia bacterium]